MAILAILCYNNMIYTNLSMRHTMQSSVSRLQASLAAARVHALRIVTAVGLSLIAGIPQAHAAIFGGQSLVMGLQYARAALTGSGIATNGSLRGLIIRILDIVLAYITLFGVAAIISAGLYLIFSNGDESGKEKAKKIILYTVIGILVIGFSRTIVAFVNSLF